MPQASSMLDPVRLPLIIAPENRDSSTNKDARLVNCYVEMDKERNLNLYRRPGLTEWVNPPAGSAAGHGVYYWNGNVYSIFGGSIYKNGASVATGMDTTGGVYSFSSTMGATPKLVMQNGVQGYSYDDVHLLSANLHSINASYPQYTCKGLAYLNGATYVLQHFFGTSITPAVIWGSAINSVDQPGDWDPLDFLTAQIETDSGVYCAKQGVYVLALKQWSTEVFFDAGNATGSPLQSVSNAKSNYGCASQDSVQNIDDVYFWICTNRSASNQVVMLSRLQPRIVSTPEIDRLLDGADLSIVYSWQYKSFGHSFYIVTIKNINLTLAYDVVMDRWSQWTDQNGNYIPIVSSTRDAAGNHILQHESNGFLYYASSQATSDFGNIIPVTIVTPEFTGNTQRNKMLGMMAFIGDQVEGSLMSVQVSDDNYKTWSQPRVVDLSMKYPNLINCGTFRRRAWKFSLNNKLPWRLSAVTLQYDIGDL